MSVKKKKQPSQRAKEENKQLRIELAKEKTRASQRLGEQWAKSHCGVGKHGVKKSKYHKSNSGRK